MSPLKKPLESGFFNDQVPERRFELLHLSALPPQDSVSTNFTTRACQITEYIRVISENRRTRTFDPLLKRQMLYRLSYILNLKKVHEYRNLLILVSLALLVPVLTTHLFTLVYRHLMAFSFFSAGHIVSVFPLVLKADNIGSFF